MAWIAFTIVFADRVDVAGWVLPSTIDQRLTMSSFVGLVVELLRACSLSNKVLLAVHHSDDFRIFVNSVDKFDSLVFGRQGSGPYAVPDRRWSSVIASVICPQQRHSALKLRWPLQGLSGVPPRLRSLVTASVASATCAVGLVAGQRNCA